jgi:beta-lactamase regulating signal transducer with metallopeptidase domain
MNRNLLAISAALGTSSLMLVDSTIKGGLILLLATIVALMLRRDSAATRHLVWLVAIVAVLVVPMFSALLPQWQVLPEWAVLSNEPPQQEPAAVKFTSKTVETPKLVISQSTPATLESEQSKVVADLPIAQVPVSHAEFSVTRSVEATDAPRVGIADVAPEVVSPISNWANWLTLFWAIGACVLMLRLVAARIMLWSNERRGIVLALSTHANGDKRDDVSNDSIVKAFEAARLRLGVRQRIKLLIHTERTIPVVWGILRCRLLLPVAARQWSDDQLQSVLLHELAHIKRRDMIAQLLAQCACALHWFNPLVWFAAWRLHVERERACDDLVLANGVRASAYAEHLLNVATRLSSSPWTQACGLAMARNSSLEDRLRAVLNQKRNRRSVTNAVVIVSLMLGGAVAVPVAMLRAAETLRENREEIPADEETSEKTTPLDKKVTDEPSGDTPKKVLTAKAAPKKYGPKDWAGWFANHARHRKLKDGFPSMAFKYLRKLVIEDLAKEPKADAASEAGDWLEATAVEKKWEEDEFIAMVERIGKWKISVIHRAMPREEFASKCSPKPGRAAKIDELQNIVFGPAAKNGLRVAWVLNPAKKKYSVGDTLSCRVVVHNSGTQSIQFLGGLDFQDGDWNIRDAAGKPMPTKALPYSNVWLHPRMHPYQRYRLAPGHLVELPGQGVGIGKGDHSASRTQIVIWRIIEAQAGDTVGINVETEIGLRGVRTKDRNGKTIHLAAGNNQFYNKDEFPEEQARDWSGTLRSGELKFEVVAEAKKKAQNAQAVDAAQSVIDVGDKTPAASPAATAVELKPQHKDGQAIYKSWQASARTDGKIPGALIGDLGEWVKYFIELNDGGDLATKFKKLQPRFVATHDWTPADAVKLLDDVAAIHRIPFSNALRSAAGRVILSGEPLPAELKNARWSKPAANGLRVAWHLEHPDDSQKVGMEPHPIPTIWMLVPSPKKYPLGSVFKSRLLVHNSGKKPVFFIMPSWQQTSKHSASSPQPPLNKQSKPLKVSSLDWTTMAQMRTVRLAPGAYFETRAPGIGIGVKASDEDWASLRPGAWIHAKSGDDVVLKPGAIEIRMSPFVVGTRHKNGFQKPKDAADLWKKYVVERVAREKPIPLGAADRKQLLRRVIGELYGVEPNQGEIDAFVRDKSPGGVHPVLAAQMVETRVMHNRSMEVFTGSLQPGEIKFRVTPADRDAAKRPRVVTGPGYYILGDKQRLHITQSRNGTQRLNSASIRFFSEPKAAPFAISLPEGRLTYAISWERNVSILWIIQKGLVRRYDFTNAVKVKETRFEPGSIDNVPERFRKTLNKSLGVPHAPVQQQQQQQQPNSKPDGTENPPSSPDQKVDPKTVPPKPASRKPASPKASVKLEAGREDNLQWGKPTNGLRAALIRPPALGQADAEQSMDFSLVIQNVSKSPIRLMANASVPNPRRVTLKSKKRGWTYSRLKVEEPWQVDVVIQPREIVVLPMVPPEKRKGTSVSRNFDVIFLGDMTIERAPPGAWTGTLVTADTYAAFAAHGLLPKHKDAKELFVYWNDGVRWNRKFPGGLIGSWQLT